MQGVLGRRKKSGVVTEFYTLSQYSLDAFRNEDDFMAGQLPPRQVICDEIMRVEAQEEGFWVHLDDRIIELVELEESSAYRWLKRLRKVLGDRVDVGAEAVHKPLPARQEEQRLPLCEGILFKNDKKKGLKSGYYVMFDSSLEYYSSQADFDAGAEVRGLVLFNEVLFFQEVEKGFVLTVDGGPGKGERLVELHSPSQDTLKSWMDAMKSILQPMLLDKFVTSATGQANSAVATVREQDEVLIEGTLSCKKAFRFCMLFTDRFEYFTSKEEYDKAPQIPRGAVYLTELDGFELSDEGFAFHIAGRRVDYKTDAKTHKDWIEAWEQAEGREIAEGIERYEKALKNEQKTASAKRTEETNGSQNATKPSANGPGPKSLVDRGPTDHFIPKQGQKEEVEDDRMTTASTNIGARSAALSGMSTATSVEDWDSSPTVAEQQAATSIQRKWRQRQSLSQTPPAKPVNAEKRMGTLKSAEVLPAKKSIKGGAHGGTNVKQPNGVSRTPRTSSDGKENDRPRRSSLASSNSETRTAEKKRVTLIEGIESWEGTFEHLADEVLEDEKKASPMTDQKSSVPKPQQLPSKAPVAVRPQSARERAQTESSEREGSHSVPYFKRAPGKLPEKKTAQPSQAIPEAKSQAIPEAKSQAIPSSKSHPVLPLRRTSSTFQSPYSSATQTPYSSAAPTPRRSSGNVQLASMLFKDVRMEGTLGIDVLGQRELRYFVVCRDNLQMYSCLEDVEKWPPQVRIGASDIRGFKVSSTFITLVMDAQNVTLRVRESSMVEPWLAALKEMVKTVEDLTIDNGLPAYEGPIKLGHRSKLEDRYGVLYKDRFETYTDRIDFKRGNKPVLCFVLGDIDSFEVQNANFMIQVRERTLKYYVYRQVDMRDWARAWYDVLAIKDAAAKSVKKWDRREINARNHKEWVANVSVVEGKVYQGPVGWEYPNGAIEPRYLVICKDRLEFFSDPRPNEQGQGNSPLHTTIKLRDMRGLKVVDDGFYIDTVSRSSKAPPPRIKVRLGEPELLDTWVFHLKTVIDRYHTDEVLAEDEVIVPQSNAMRMHPLEAIPPNSLFAVPKKEMMQSELQHPLVQSWISKESPTHSGLLGIMRAGEMTLRFFTLFPDRLDAWNRPMDAASCLRPVLHIPMSDIRSVETVSSGLIVNCRGKKIGIHVSTNNELHEWSQALLKALAPASRSSSVPPRGMNNTALKTRVLSTERTSTVGRARSEERSRRSASPRSTVPKGAQSYYARHPFPESQPITDARQRTEFFKDRAINGRVNLPHNSTAGGEYANGDVSAKVSGAREEIVRPMESVTQKINHESERTLKPGPEPGWCPWSKVTCMEDNGGYTPPRSRSPTPSPRASPRTTPCASPRTSPRAEVTQKINCADDRTFSRPVRDQFTPKVNGTDRAPLKREVTPRRSVSDAPFKVTDVGKPGRGWGSKDPHSNSLDRTAPLAQRQHHAYSMSRARTPR